jgi:hypothetical protein
MLKSRKITWVSLIVLAATIKILSCFPATVERYYSQGIYQVIARVLRLLFGWIPFSVGDLLYISLIGLLIYRVILFTRRLIKKELRKGWVLRFARQFVFVVLWVYVLFNGLWGLNYDRLGIADQLQLKVRPYTTAELGNLLEVIVGELNQLDSISRLHRDDLARMRVLRTGAINAYDSLALQAPKFGYHSPSVKASLFSYPGVFLGYAGYYNPFTGEAQVNTWNPLFTQPYTTCHEMGHQLGYAKENEANFIGFLAARSSPDPAFQYSVFFDMYIYAWRELYFRDSTLAKSFRARLRPGMRQDLQELQRFNRKYANSLEPVIWKAYGKYLRANRQPRGIVTYSEVTAWLIAYEKKNGVDALLPAKAKQ